MKLSELRQKVVNVTFDDTAVDELKYYNDQFQRIYIGSMFESFKKAEDNPVYFLLNHSWDLMPEINDINFDNGKSKLLLLIHDLTQFMAEKKIEERFFSGDMNI